MHPSLSRLRTAGITLGLLAGAPSVALAQFDAQVTNIKWAQSIQVNMATDLAAGKPTMVRALVALTNPPTNPVMLDGIMRVYVDGVEASFSPVYSDNGPYPASTTAGNWNLENDTLNFTFIPPASNDVLVEVEINPPGPNFVPEADTSNNTKTSGPREFKSRGTPELVYSPINYTLGGGLPNTSLIEPGVGDNFIQGIYAPADWFYHRTDAPSKTWNQSLNGSGSALNNSLLADLNLMVPKPDFIYGWVPGGLPYNGQAIGIPGKAAMGNTQTFKHQRTFAHEIGHLLGFPHNSTLLGFYGNDVEEGLAITQNLPLIKADNLNDIMVPGLNTNQAWIARPTYINSFNNGAFQPGPVFTGPGLLVTGVWNRERGELVLDNVLNLPAVNPTDAVPEEEASFVVQAWAGGQLIERVPIAAGAAGDSCGDREGEDTDSVVPLEEVSVTFAMLSGAELIDRLEFLPLQGAESKGAVLTRSAGKPVVQFVSPGPDGDVSAGQVEVSWAGSDPDGDPLTYYLRYSRDGFHYSPLASGIRATEWTVDVAELPAFTDGQGYFEVLASDGLNTTVAKSPLLTGGGNLWAGATNPPWVEIMTPDNGKSYLEGATVILHSSGWDLEDRGLLDPALLWQSSIDGTVGNGRLLSIATLSAGVHNIRVTATDSSGLTASDIHQITIVARGLPRWGRGDGLLHGRNLGQRLPGPALRGGHPQRLRADRLRRHGRHGRGQQGRALLLRDQRPSGQPVGKRHQLPVRGAADDPHRPDDRGRYGGAV